MKVESSLKMKVIEVFVTDIRNDIQVKQLSKELNRSFPTLKTKFDLNKTELPYPCGHTVLRVEGDKAHCDKIASTINHLGFKCDVLEDKVCI